MATPLPAPSQAPAAPSCSWLVFGDFNSALLFNDRDLPVLIGCRDSFPLGPDVINADRNGLLAVTRQLSGCDSRLRAQPLPQGLEVCYRARICCFHPYLRRDAACSSFVRDLLGAVDDAPVRRSFGRLNLLAEFLIQSLAHGFEFGPQLTGACLRGEGGTLRLKFPLRRWRRPDRIP